MTAITPPGDFGGEIRDTPLSQALSERYLAYALSTIVSRSLPDVRDGLKPVHRRLLYAMRQLKLDPATGYKKCARVVGDVMGKYHPHGDLAIYDALVRLAQDFAVRYPLVDGQGNFGNIDGDNPAAMRYTESRLTEIAAALLDGIDEDTVDFRTTYDGEEEEPIVLPANFPNLLANGSTGIAVGMATNIPPHNAGELCDALIHLIKFPNATFDKLCEFVPGPDFPTGGVLVEDHAAVVEAYRTGRGAFRLRAKWQVEDQGRGQYEIVITEIPYQIQKAKLIERIADLIIGKKLPILQDVRDESTEDVRIVLEPKSRTVDAETLMEHLFRETDLEIRFNMNMNVLDANNTPGVMSLRDVLQAFLDHRHKVLIRRKNFRLEKIERRMEVLGGLLVAFLNLDEIIKIIREEDEPKTVLMKRFDLTEVQANAILDMRLRQLRKLEEIEIRRENEDLGKERQTIKTLLKDEGERWKAIAAEIAETKKAFGQKTEIGARRTEIAGPPTAVVVPLEAMIEKEPITVVLSEKGWIRALKGHVEPGTEVKFKDGDNLKFMVHGQTTDKFLVFATNGRFYTLAGDKLPGGRGHGEPVRLMVDIPNGHDPIWLQVYQTGKKYVVASDKGRGFIVPSDDLMAQTKNGKQVLNLGTGEEAAAIAEVMEGADAVAVVGENRKLLIFPIDELPEMGRGKGVILQRYNKGGLADITTMRFAEGLTWRSGGQRTEPEYQQWLGKRAQAGLVVPKGFPRSGTFGRD
ncbi:DNA topoisomerase IV subunit A [bacterium SCSIO 12827]|nr:DNA topoisomerase IV subunit A [bacterium SCSIO 12827]